jgi:hypothetical protein
MPDKYTPTELEFETSGSVHKIKLTKEQGLQIKELIQEHFTCSFPWYCDRVGIKPPNFYNVVNGERTCTLEFLNKLLSGINYQVTASQILLVHPMPNGEGVLDADSLLQENESHLNEEEVPDEYD